MKAHLQAYGQQVETWLAKCLRAEHMSHLPERLCKAMEYSLMAGGKRLRPVLCLSTAKLCGLRQEAVMPFAAAIEMIHTYSLIHDDLPAMDDDDLRRGKPSNHKQFDEATAILAGDALLTDAFAFMCSVAGDVITPRACLNAVQYVAKAAGSCGMVGGQMLDMVYTGVYDGAGVQPSEHAITLEKMRAMHALKTGALIQASCVSGAVLSGADTATVIALEGYGKALGTAFQIVDDILDITADTATLGKPAGSDVEQGKSTYPALVGLEKSKQLAQEEKDKALTYLNEFEGVEAEFLRSLATYVVERTS